MSELVVLPGSNVIINLKQIAYILPAIGTPYWDIHFIGNYKLTVGEVTYNIIKEKYSTIL